MRTARVVTLASASLLIALCVPGALGAVSRPAAPPGPPTDLARFYDQRPAWHRCGGGAEYPASYRCATVTVPLDYAHPTGPTLRLRISRLNTSVPGKRHGVLLTNSGGPGHRGLDDPLSMRETLTKKVRDRYDLIGLDPRGLGASSPLQCGLTEDEASSDERPYRAATFAEDTARARRIAAKCVAREGARLPYINTRNTARDLDVLRGVLGERKISYVGWSYGTQIGAVYTQLFPGRSDRMVLDSAVDPNRFGRHSDLVMSAGSEAAFRDWSRLTARRDGTYHLGDTPAEVRAAFWKQVARADRAPLLYNGSDMDHQGWALTGADIRAWLRVEFFNTPSDAARHLVELRRSVGTRPQPESAGGGRADAATDNIVSLHWAVTCGDNSASWPRDPDRYRRDAVRDRVRYPLYGDVAANITPCAFWPRGAEAATRVDNRVGALVVHNQWDSQTPLSEGLAMRRALHGARLLQVDGGRGHAIYGFPGAPACVTATVDTYLAEGRLPAQDTTCRA